MSEIRSFYYPYPTSVNDCIQIKDSDFHHIKNVLRLKENSTIVLLSTTGKYKGTIIALSNTFVTVRITEKENPKISLPNIHLIQGIPKGWKMDEIIEKSSQMGVSTIYPVFMNRSIPKFSAEEEQSKRNRWEKISIAASKQSRRDMVPKISPIQSFETLIPNLSSFLAGKIIFWELESDKTLADYLRANRINDYLLVIGPEGGISHEEVKFCGDLGFTSLSLGDTILRTETAAPFAVGLTKYLWNIL